MWAVVEDNSQLAGRTTKCNSWVIWTTPVTVESEGSFLSVFVFFEGQ